MAEFSQTIHDFWRSPDRNGHVLAHEDSFTLIVDPTLREDRRVTVLQTVDGAVTAAVTDEVACRLVLASQRLDESTFGAALNDAGIALYDADCLYYLAEPAKAAVRQEPADPSIRRLTQDDGEVFEAFSSSASAQDLDDAYVELDHWAVFGCFDGDRLVSAASMYPWDGSRIADLGVLTLAESRGRGHARSVVRAICRHACALGYEPQYCSQLDNHASVALGHVSGFHPVRDVADRLTRVIRTIAAAPRTVPRMPNTSPVVAVDLLAAFDLAGVADTLGPVVEAAVAAPLVSCSTGAGWSGWALLPGAATWIHFTIEPSL